MTGTHGAVLSCFGDVCVTLMKDKFDSSINVFLHMLTIYLEGLFVP